jgi:flagellar protein FlgJ
MTPSLAIPLPGATFDNLQAVETNSKDKRDSPEEIGKAATQFEALMIGEVMKSAREAGGGSWMGTGDDEAGSTMMEVSEQQLALALSNGGGLGLAKMISGGLAATVRHNSQPQPTERDGS